MELDRVKQIPPKTNEVDSRATTLEELVEFAENKLEEYGIADQFEVVTSSRMKRAVGRASHKGVNKLTGDVHKGKLKLSSVWFDEIGMEKLIEEGVDEDFGEDVVLHELAHCLDYVERGESDHSYKWKENARRVGADPTRTFDLPQKLHELTAKFKRVCSHCGEVTEYYYKKPHSNKDRACGKCCDKHNNGRFSEEYLVEVRENDPAI